MAEKYGKVILTAYELQPVGEYGLEEYNTYHNDGLDAVEKNYEEQFGGTDVCITFHNRNMMRKLNPARDRRQVTPTVLAGCFLRFVGCFFKNVLTSLPVLQT